jgi:hypothetical protein
LGKAIASGSWFVNDGVSSIFAAATIPRAAGSVKSNAGDCAKIIRGGNMPRLSPSLSAQPSIGKFESTTTHTS